MCGICGVAGFDDPESIRVSIERMTGFLGHRGPDDVGCRVFRNVGLGHTRLSIVDLEGGHQPMSNEDGSVWVVFNGEIYNHRELRGWLIDRGHQFRTRCDTEAIVHLYEELGTAFVERLRGMFALALWDGRRERVILARDRLGVKPLYYALASGGRLAFASEIESLFASGLLAPRICEDVVPEFFASGHVAGERTLLDGVRKLNPGTLLEWEEDSVRSRHYWSLEQATEGSGEDFDDRSSTDYSEEFWRRFVESVRLRLMADVPLGVFLSGGIDSGLIAAAMRECGVDDVRTFSVGYGDERVSELPEARKSAAALGTLHRELKIGSDDFFGSLVELTRHRGFPLVFPASIPLALLAKMAREDVKVVLTGEGADELFAGYGRYLRGILNVQGGRLLDRALPDAIRRSLAENVLEMASGGFGRRARRSFLVRSGDVSEAYFEAFAHYDSVDRASLFAGTLQRSTDDRWKSRPLAFLDPDLVGRNLLEALLRLDQGTYLEELLAKQDHMSMFGSIESRVPYLDHPLVEWAARLPSEQKLRFGRGKRLMRRAAKAHLPPSVAGGPKRGFPLPLESWLRKDHGGVWEAYAPQPGDALFDSRWVRSLMEEHRRGEDHTSRLWLLLAFQVWREEVVPQLGSGTPHSNPHTEWQVGRIPS